MRSHFTWAFKSTSGAQKTQVILGWGAFWLSLGPRVGTKCMQKHANLSFPAVKLTTPKKVRSKIFGYVGLTGLHPPIGNTHFSGHTACFNFFCQMRQRMPPDAPPPGGGAFSQKTTKNPSEIYNKLIFSTNNSIFDFSQPY